MKTSAILLAAAAFGSAQAGFNGTVTDVDTSTVTVPCSTSTSIPYLGSAPLGTGTVTFTPPGNGSHTYTRPTLSPTTSPTTTGTTTGPSSVVTAGASSLDARVFVGAVAAVAAIAFSL
ncbi:hypothetical protein Sste5346_010461 [Sporothrix stenoceras]|uniref:GPI anchored protein n=1 Tax=Sporothrix stenoceras TaxID=5173 RepID=A0ABR3YFJ5_9PEZI